ncbi:hypothetical protein COJ15_32730 [Bacillus thuringiensis]|uniref:Uncharacterized protein n=1 Tax=Bacillus thuringiensis TaxID=1428 RepID=A0A9X6WGP5_BACTU|nr:hypothetical protein COJ15_32730 [Bacillus thuringiensis]
MDFLIILILFFSMILVNLFSPIILKQKYRLISIAITVFTLIGISPIMLFIIFKGDPESDMYGYVFMSYLTYPVIFALAIINIIMIVKQKKKKG